MKNWHTRIGLTRDQTAVFGLTILWTVLTLWNVGLPGLYFDEVNHFALIPGILSEEAAKLHHYRLYDNWLDYQDGTLRYPILAGSFYNTTIRSYISLPYFFITGYSTESLRIFTSLIGFSAVLSLAWLVRRLFGLISAVVLAFLLALDTNDVFSLRAQGGLFWFVILFLSLSGHSLLTAGRAQDSSIWHAALGGAFVSLAVLCYFIGIFIAIPMIACALYVYRKRISHAVVYILSGLLAYSPVIYAVISAYLKKPESLITYGMPKFARVAQETTGTSEIERVLDVLRGTFIDASYAKSIVGPGVMEFSWLRAAAIALFSIALLLLAIRIVRERKHAAEQVAFYSIFLSSALVYGLALYFFKSINHHHLIPFHAFFLALLSSLLVTQSRARMLAGATAAVLLCTSAASTLSAHSELRANGGMGFHNERVSLPAQLLPTAFKDYHPVFVSWGFHLQYLFLTNGQSSYTFMGRPVKDRIESALHRHRKIAVIVSASDRNSLVEQFTLENEYPIQSRNGVYLYSIGLLSVSPAESSGKADPRSEAPTFQGTRILNVVPNPVDFCSLETSIVEVHWNVSNAGPVVLQIFVEDSAGKRTLWAAPAAKIGSDFTGEWVQKGSRFIAVDALRKTVLATAPVQAKTCQ